MAESKFVTFDCMMVDARMRLDAGSQILAMAASREHLVGKPWYDCFIQSAPLTSHEELLSAVRRTIRQLADDEATFVVEGFDYNWALTEPDVDTLLTDHRLGNLPKTIGSLLQQYPGAQRLRDRLLATLREQAGLLTARLVQLGRDAGPVVRVLVAAESPGMELAGDPRETLLGIGDIISYTVECVAGSFQPPKLVGSEIRRVISTP